MYLTSRDKRGIWACNVQGIRLPIKINVKQEKSQKFTMNAFYWLHCSGSGYGLQWRLCTQHKINNSRDRSFDGSMNLMMLSENVHHVLSSDANTSLFQSLGKWRTELSSEHEVFAMMMVYIIQEHGNIRIARHPPQPNESGQKHPNIMTALGFNTVISTEYE